jgi:hypothetical protein
MRRLAFAALVAAVLPLFTVAGAVPASAAATYRAPLRTAVAALPVVAEHRAGYVRTAFTHWIDADRDGCSTRNEVLHAEAVVKPRIGAKCVLTGGRWVSYYDRKTWTAASRIDIDHLVPLAEAWDSGAWRWTAAQRKAYANDLGDARTLVGVTDTVNQAKGDRDFAQWLPTYDRCRYLGEWTAVKLRWRLTVDATEKAAMTRLAASCTNATLGVVRAL